MIIDESFEDYSYCMILKCYSVVNEILKVIAIFCQQVSLYKD